LATFYLVRHGTTAWVDQQFLHGITDIPLNENGIQQARQAAKALYGIQASYLFSSPLQRAMQTAEIIGKAIELTPIPTHGLIEINFGWMEGKKILDDVHNEFPKFVYMINHQWLNFIRLISGDSRKAFQRRVEQEWQRIQEECRNENAVIVAHSGVLDVILTKCFGEPQQNDRPYYSLHPCSITEIFQDEQGNMHLIRLDDHTHLKEWYPNGH
jgi:broad specificity phosphatase PhoE